MQYLSTNCHHGITIIYLICYAYSFDIVMHVSFRFVTPVLCVCMYLLMSGQNSSIIIIGFTIIVSTVTKFKNLSGLRVTWFFIHVCEITNFEGPKLRLKTCFSHCSKVQNDLFALYSRVYKYPNSLGVTFCFVNKSKILFTLRGVLTYSVKKTNEIVN